MRGTTFKKRFVSLGFLARFSKAEGNNSRRDFERMLKTDGYAVSVMLSKAKVEATGYGMPPPEIDLAGIIAQPSTLTTMSFSLKQRKRQCRHCAADRRCGHQSVTQRRLLGSSGTRQPASRMDDRCSCLQASVTTTS